MNQLGAILSKKYQSSRPKQSAETKVKTKLQQSHKSYIETKLQQNHKSYIERATTELQSLHRKTKAQESQRIT